MFLKKSLTQFSSICLSVLALTACGDKTPEQNTTPASAPVVKEASGYKVGVHLNYLPFHYRNEKGEAFGFEMDLLREVAKAGGFEVNIIDATPEQRKNFAEELNKGTFDMWASTISITPERAEQVDFSDPFLDFENVVHVHEKSPIHKAADLKDKKIAVSKVSKSAPELAVKFNGDPKKVVPMETFFAALKQIYLMQADAVLGDSRVLAYYAQQSTAEAAKTRVISLGEPKKEFAFAVKKGNQELIGKLNAGLKTVRENGTLAKLEQKWFGASATK